MIRRFLTSSYQEIQMPNMQSAVFEKIQDSRAEIGDVTHSIYVRNFRYMKWHVSPPVATSFTTAGPFNVHQFKRS